MSRTYSITEEKFCARDFVQNLLEEGIKCPCDESLNSFNTRRELPPFYDEELYKRGQKFFHDNIFALLYSKFLGLLSTLSVPSVVKMLNYTNNSSSSLAAYRRYLSTVLHMCIWYQSDFSPNSKLWQSMMLVKNKHNYASKKCVQVGLGRITQKDMAITQFGFMGYAVFQSEKVGLYHIDYEDLRAFIHVWRVVGYVMGTEDRFNICRDSVEETREICRIIAQDVLRPLIEKKDHDFITMATYLSDGMWSMNPTLNAKIYLNIVHSLLTPNYIEPNNKNYFIPLNIFQRFILNLVSFVIWSLQFEYAKRFWNWFQYVCFWLMKFFPFLAYYQFGRSNSHVSPLN